MKYFRDLKLNSTTSCYYPALNTDFDPANILAGNLYFTPYALSENQNLVYQHN